MFKKKPTTNQQPQQASAPPVRQTVVGENKPTSIIDRFKSFPSKCKAKLSNKSRLQIVIPSVILFSLVAGLFFYVFLYNPSYKVGDQTVTKKDLNNSTAAYVKAQSMGKERNTKDDKIKIEAENRAILLAGLKSEADTQGVDYSEATIDKYNASVYGEKGGKQAYMQYMKTTYKWAEEDVYQIRTLEYLKDKLENSILTNREFTSIYIRWDNLRRTLPANYQKEYSALEKELKTGYLPLLKRRVSYNQLKNKVEVYEGLKNETILDAYKKNNMAPITLVREDPDGITYDKAFYYDEKTKQDIKYNEGKDPKTVFAGLKKVGETTGPVQLSDGRLLVARLDTKGAGNYESWDVYINDLRNKSGLSVDDKETALSTTIKNKLDRIAGLFKEQSANAVAVTCHTHTTMARLHYKFTNSDTNTPITEYISFSLSAQRYFGSGNAYNTVGCSEDSYPPPYTVSPSTGEYRTVTAVTGTIDGIADLEIDCMGGEWSPSTPNVNGFDFVSGPTYTGGTWGNSLDKSYEYKYKPKVTQQQLSCDLSISYPGSGITATASWTSNGAVGTASLRSSNGNSTSGLALNNSSYGIKPWSSEQNAASNPSRTYTLTVQNATGTTKECSATVTYASSAVLSCSINISYPGSGITATASWTSNGAVGTASLRSSNGNSTSGLALNNSSYGIKPWSSEQNAASNPSRTYTLTVQNATGTTKECSATVTYNAPPCNDCTCQQCEVVTYSYAVQCEVSVWRANSNGDKEGDKIPISVNSRIPLNVGEKLYISAEPTLRETRTGSISGVTITNQDLRMYPNDGGDPGFELKNEYGDRAAFSGGAVSPRYTSNFRLSLSNVFLNSETGKRLQESAKRNPTGPEAALVGGDGCFSVQTDLTSPCVIGTPSINTVFNRSMPSSFSGKTTPLGDRAYRNPNLVPQSGLVTINYTPQPYMQQETYQANPAHPVYDGQVLTWALPPSIEWDIGNGEVGKKNWIVSVVTKDGEAIESDVLGRYSPYDDSQMTTRKSTAFPGTYRLVDTTFTTAGGVFAGIPVGFPKPAEWIRNSEDLLGYKRRSAVNSIYPATFGFLKARSGNDYYYGGDWWQAFAVPYEATHNYTVKMYNLDMEGVETLEQFYDKFDSLTDTNGVPPSSTKIAECGFGENNPEPESKPANKPFLRVSGGDTRAGAKFAGATTAVGDECSAYGTDGGLVKKSKALDAEINANGFYGAGVDGGPSGDSLKGASSGQYGVFASGQIRKTDEKFNNFLANNIYTRTARKDLLFSNASDPYGKYYNGGDGVPCIDVSKLVKDTEKSTELISSILGASENKKALIEGDASIDSTTVNKSKVVVIKGNLKITGNITYASNYGDLESLPNLTVIVLGNITVDKSVSKLDGTYIAYPTNSDNGIFSACDVSPTTNLVIDTCKQKLTISGRLLAKKIFWNRTFGTVGKFNTLPTANGDDAVSDGGCAVGVATAAELTGQLEKCSAEYIDFSPEAYFNTGSQSSTQSVGTVPVYTVELPPVY